MISLTIKRQNARKFLLHLLSHELDNLRHFLKVNVLIEIFIINSEKVGYHSPGLILRNITGITT
jgi:hypothetical protein